MENIMKKEHFDELKRFMSHICHPDRYEVFIKKLDGLDPLSILDGEDAFTQKYDAKLLHEALAQMASVSWRNKYDEERIKMHKGTIEKYSKKIEELEKKNASLKNEVERLRTVSCWLDQLKSYEKQVLEGDKNE